MGSLSNGLKSSDYLSCVGSGEQVPRVTGMAQER